MLTPFKILNIISLISTFLFASSCISSNQTRLQTFSKNKSVACFPPLVIINRTVIAPQTNNDLKNIDPEEKTIKIIDSLSNFNPFDSANFSLNTSDEMIALDYWAKYPILLTQTHEPKYVQIPSNKLLKYYQELDLLSNCISKIPSDLQPFLNLSNDSICLFIYSYGEFIPERKSIDNNLAHAVVTTAAFVAGGITGAIIAQAPVPKVELLKSQIIIVRKSSGSILYHNYFETKLDPLDGSNISTHLNKLFEGIATNNVDFE